MPKVDVLSLELSQQLPKLSADDINKLILEVKEREKRVEEKEKRVEERGKRVREIEKRAEEQMKVIQHDLNVFKSRTIAMFFVKNGCMIKGIERCGSFSKSSVSKNHHAVQVIKAKFGFSKFIPKLNELYKLNSAYYATYHDFNLFATEKDIQSRVCTLLTDMLKAAKTDDSIMVLEEFSLNGKPDVWVVLKRGIPISIIEVKKPIDDVHDKRTFGQVFDYMKSIKDTFSIEHVLGVVTTFNQFNFCSFKHSKSLFESEELDEKVLNVKSDSESTTRELLVSVPISCESEDLPFALVSYLQKISFVSKFSKPVVNVNIKKRKHYAHFTKKTWCWRKIETKKSDKLSLLPIDKSESNEYLVIKELGKGVEGRVHLVFVLSNFKLGALKIYHCAKEAEERVECEVRSWKTIGIEVQRVVVCNSQGLLMPVVFQCEKDKNNHIFFKDSLAYWHHKPEIARDEDVEYLKECQELIKKWTPKNALTTAVNYFEQKNLVHNDMEWRHLSLLPVFEELEGDWKVSRLQPMFIDLTNVCKLDSKSKRNNMRERMEELLKEIVHD